MFERKSLNPIERYLHEVRLSSILNGYNMSNGVVLDSSISKEVLKEEMRRVEQYIAAREELNMSRKLR